MSCLFLNCRDFDVRLYLCNGAFEFLGVDTVERLSQNGVFPIYAVGHFILVVLIVIGILKKWQWYNSLHFKTLQCVFHCHSLLIIVVGTVHVVCNSLL